MAIMTKEEIVQLKQQLVEKMKEVKAIEEQLMEAGELEVSEELANQVSGGIPDLGEFGPYIIEQFMKHHPGAEFIDYS